MTKVIPILVGPTGSGKTAVGLELARALKADVISADSGQVYKDLRAGTAKPEGRWERGAYQVEGVAHHLMDVIPPTERYSAGDFARQAAEVIERRAARSERCVIVGGTGLYIRALVDGLAPLPPRDEALREKLSARAAREGRPALHRELAQIDPDAARGIPPNNIARVVRALEVHSLTGKPLSWWQKEKTRPSQWPFKWFGLRWKKEELLPRLEERCRAMTPGILEETERLLDAGVPATAPAFQALGYRSAMRHLKGDMTARGLEDAFSRETKLYVKRQMTWFRANPRIHWLDVSAASKPSETARKVLRELVK